MVIMVYSLRAFRYLKLHSTLSGLSFSTGGAGNGARIFGFPISEIALIINSRLSRNKESGLGVLSGRLLDTLYTYNVTLERWTGHNS